LDAELTLEDCVGVIALVALPDGNNVDDFDEVVDNDVVCCD
ncbi:7781_t:CDS:2, partial [Dentiscutata heterogama]